MNRILFSFDLKPGTFKNKWEILKIDKFDGERWSMGKISLNKDT